MQAKLTLTPLTIRSPLRPYKIDESRAHHPRHIRPDLPHPVGPQVTLVPHHVWHCLGRGILSSAGWAGRRFPLGQQARTAQYGKDIMFIYPGRAPVVQGSMNSARTYLLTYQDYADVRKEAPHVRNASPVLIRGDVSRGE